MKLDELMYPGAKTKSAQSKKTIKAMRATGDIMPKGHFHKKGEDWESTKVVTMKEDTAPMKVKLVPDSDDYRKIDVLVDLKKVGVISKVEKQGVGGYDVRVNLKKIWGRTLGDAKKIARAMANNDETLLPLGYKLS